MADRATYFLMATYMILFACVFVGVFYAIWLMGREQPAEQPMARVADQRPPVRTPVTSGEAAASAALAPPEPALRVS